MEWSFPEENERHRASLLEGDGSVSLTSVTRTESRSMSPTQLFWIRASLEWSPSRLVARTSRPMWLGLATPGGSTSKGVIHEVLFHEQEEDIGQRG